MQGGGRKAGKTAPQSHWNRKTLRCARCGYAFGSGITRIVRNPLSIQFVHLNYTAMNAESIKGNWNEIKGKIKQQYGQLTDDDLAFEEGKEDELYGRLQQKLGKSKDEVRKFIADL